MLALYSENVSLVQSWVLAAYCWAFASRDLFIDPCSELGDGPYLFSDRSGIKDKSAHCYWTWEDLIHIPSEAGDCAWVWHHGPSREVLTSDNRVLLVPRTDLFSIRGIENSPKGWFEYRSRICGPWHEKRDEMYFLGHFTGEQGPNNSRVLACRLLQRAGLPANVGLLPNLVPRDLLSSVPIKKPEPLYVMGQCKYVLSLWGNHPFNPRLYRGLEGGSLVFHQATPALRLLEDGLLEPGKHYVEIAPDLSDLIEKFDYFRTHPSEARDIAEAGHVAWMQNLFVKNPHTFSEIIWERFTSQPRWRLFRETFDVH
jgi:hypothetical protein